VSSDASATLAQKCQEHCPHDSSLSWRLQGWMAKVFIPREVLHKAELSFNPGNIFNQKRKKTVGL